jgi:short-subunit dehydrogenase
MHDFNNKYGPWALVAGASEGLGAAFAEQLAQLGLNLILIARRSDPLHSLSAHLQEKYGVQIVSQALDLSDFETTKQFVSSLDLEVGLLVYNAAYAPIGYFEDIAEKDLDMIVSVNIRTPLLLSKLLSSKMIANRRGGIVLMSSLAGTQGSPKIATYAASKGFLMILAEGLWSELKEHGVDVVACCAGAIITPGYQNAQSQKAPGTLEPYQVAQEALHALGKGATVVPGFTNKMARFFMGRVFPRRWAISIMKKNTKNLS